jgi:ADP-ribose pyrophosphatase YjhB (NUDIX family)
LIGTKLKFCSACAGTVTLSIPAGDNRPRYCCAACGAIHYQNPKLVLGTIPIWGEQVLLCRRAIEPRYGFWTLPAGFMENGESTEEGAARETSEEAGARIQLGPLYSVLDVPHVDQVHLFFRAQLVDTDFDPGPESLEVQLFSEADIPWQSLAFRTVEQTLRWFFEDRERGSFPVRTTAIRYQPRPL